MGTSHHPHSARSCEPALRPVGAARGRPWGAAPLAWPWGVQGWALSLARPPVLGACGRGPLPTSCWRGRRGRGDPSSTPQRALLRAGFARCWGGTGAPRVGRLLPLCGASGVGRSPTPDRPSLRRAAVARYPLAVGAGAVGVGTPHQPDCARSCELSLRAVGAARGRPGGAPLAWGWGVRVGALSHARTTVLGACGRGQLRTGCGYGGVGVGTRHRPQSACTCELALRAVEAARGGGGATPAPTPPPRPSHPSSPAAQGT